MSSLKISIIIPSYNHNLWLESTLLSVIGQAYSNLEIIVIDGGSTDGSVELIKSYESNIAFWISEPDAGQSAAINKGISRASGDLIGWLNSDDMLLPNALNTISAVALRIGSGIFTGNIIHFQEQLNLGVKAWGSDVLAASKTHKLEICDFIIQPGTFFTRDVWVKVGKLKEDLVYGFDWEWFLRCSLSGVHLEIINAPLALYRIHNSQKTSAGGLKRKLELIEISGRYSKKYGELLRLVHSQSKLKKRFWIRFFLKFTLIIGFDFDFPKLLKFLFGKRLKRYTVGEIRSACLMIG